VLVQGEREFLSCYSGTGFVGAKLAIKKFKEIKENERK
jgi:hypothetical protein